MKTKFTTPAFLGLKAVCLSAVVWSQVLAADAKPGAAPGDLAADAKHEEAGESIITDRMPVPDLVRLLARQAGIKVFIHPKVTSGVGPDGKPVPPMEAEALNYPTGVTAKQALTEVLSAYQLTMTLNPETGIHQVNLRDPSVPEPLETEVFQLKYTNPTNITALIKATLSARGQVLAESRTSQLVVLATKAELKSISKLLDRLDTKTRQVLIEARLIETSKNPTSVKGIDWSGTLSAQKFSFGNGLSSAETKVESPGNSTTTTLPSGRTVTSTEPSSKTTTTTTALDPLANLVGMSAGTVSGWNPGTAFLNADGVSAVLSFLNQDNDSEVVANPREVTMDNETATLEVTRSFPIFTQNPGSAQVAATTQIQYTNVGVILKVTPRISADNQVSMKVTPEVSNIDSKDRQVVNGAVNEANVYATRKIQTQVMIPSGHTLVMGGLISDSKNKAYTKVPILGDIPGIGLAFRHENKKRSKSNLIIFLTPTIVKDENFQPTESSFLNQPIPKDGTDSVESAWDSGKPHNWSKPVY